MSKTSEYQQLSDRIRYSNSENRERRLKRQRERYHNDKNFREQKLASQRKFYREHRLTTRTSANMKNQKIVGKKRPYPTDSMCELCNKIKKTKYLAYHHWKIDNNGNIYGIWVCHWCHVFIEYFERNMQKTWLKIKEDIEESNPEEW